MFLIKTISFRKLFCREECLLVNVSIKRNHHFAISNEIYSGKDHQWMLNSLGERMMGNWVFHGIKMSQIMCWSQGANYKFIMEGTSCHNLNPVIDHITYH